jgi:cell division protease FtsH
MSPVDPLNRKDPGSPPPPRRPLRGGLPKRPNVPNQGKPFRSAAFWVILAIGLLAVFQIVQFQKVPVVDITYTQFMKEVEAGNIQEITFTGQQVEGVLVSESTVAVGNTAKQVKQFRTVLPFAPSDSDLAQKVQEKNPDALIKAKLSEGNWWLRVLLSGVGPILIIVIFWIFLMRQMQAGGNKAFSFGKSKARLIDQNRQRVTFEDVAGADEAKEELEEIIDFLKDPKRFQKLGGRIPKGALLLGPPGTGKTLLARAVAGEANVPFFSMSGSDFVEMFVGVGASRVRDLFETGKKNAPCILFVDEIDAVGRHRGAGLGGGHDEREQTLNQLLVEMDGFESNEGVIILAATNRPDVLDPALLRPGRFDRQIIVDMPDVKGREGILKVHSRKIPLSDDVDLGILARATPGMSGADLANMVNEAALLAARRRHGKVTMEDFEDAKDKVLLGPERKSRIITEDVKKMTAYHEAGHAVVGSKLEYSDPVHKVTIVPRGRSGGATYFLPSDDRNEVSRDWCLDTITHALGGRCAEELVLKRIGSGAESDIQRVSRLARKMVTQWGMSDRLGPIQFGEREEMVFLGKEIHNHQDYSESTARIIDEEVSGIVNKGRERATRILEENIDILHKMASALLERETLDREEIDLILAGKDLPPMRSAEPSKKKPEKTEPEPTEAEKERGLSGGIQPLPGEAPT